MKNHPWLIPINTALGFQGKLFSVDSTTIDLCLSVYPWAKFHHKKGAVKIHTVLDHDSLIPVFADATHGRIHKRRLQVQKECGEDSNNVRKRVSRCPTWSSCYESAYSGVFNLISGLVFRKRVKLSNFR